MHYSASASLRPGVAYVLNTYDSIMIRNVRCLFMFLEHKCDATGEGKDHGGTRHWARWDWVHQQDNELLAHLSRRSHEAREARPCRSCWKSISEFSASLLKYSSCHSSIFSILITLIVSDLELKERSLACLTYRVSTLQGWSSVVVIQWLAHSMSYHHCSSLIPNVLNLNAASFWNVRAPTVRSWKLCLIHRTLVWSWSLWSLMWLQYLLFQQEILSEA